MTALLKGQFQKQVEQETKNIFNFWIDNAIDTENQGFYGEITNDLLINKEAEKGLILNSRILWAFSLAYRELEDQRYLEIADRAYDYLLQNFWDKEYAGMYWMLDCKGNVVNDRKQIYGQAFSIYALSEYYRAIAKEESLEQAIELFELIEKYSYDSENKGYIEACSREWNELEDLRLSEKDMNEKKSMNTHLHILEAYTNLFRVWKDERLEEQLKELIEVTIEYIIDSQTYHFILFFDEKWTSKSDLFSYGHDIEGSWLLYEAAEVLGDQELIEKVAEIAVKMAEVTYEEGLDEDWAVLYEGDPTGIIDSDKHWWPQAEAVVGFLNAYQLTGEDKYLEVAKNIWSFIEEKIIDQEHGEWFWMVSKEGIVSNKISKVNSWKGPYHNGRACFEIVNRLEKIKKEMN